MSDWKWAMSSGDWWVEGEREPAPPLQLYGRVREIGAPMKLGVRSLQFSQVIGIRNGKVVAKCEGRGADTMGWHSQHPPLPPDVEEQIAAAPVSSFAEFALESEKDKARREAEEKARYERSEAAIARVGALDEELIATRIARRESIRVAAAAGPRTLREVALRTATQKMRKAVKDSDGDRVKPLADAKIEEITKRVLAIVGPVSTSFTVSSLPEPEWLHAWWADRSVPRVDRRWKHVAKAFWGYDTPINFCLHDLYIAKEQDGTFALWSFYTDDEYTLSAQARFASPPTLREAALVLLEGWYEHLRDQCDFDNGWPDFTPGLITEDDYAVIWSAVFGERDQT